jgi:hypothetical protein
VGRTQRALTSLVAAIPAGYLSYLLIMVFLSKADTLKTSMQVIAAVTLLAAIFVAAMPFILLVPSRKKNVPASTTAVPKDDVDAEADSVGDESREELSATDDFAFDDSGSRISSASEELFTSDPEISLDDLNAFALDEDEDEEPAPKTRRK